MLDFINKIIPHVVDKVDELWLSIWQTFVMLGISGAICNGRYFSASMYESRCPLPGRVATQT